MSASRRSFLKALAGGALSALAAACGLRPGAEEGLEPLPGLALPSGGDIPPGAAGAGAGRVLDPSTGMSITPNPDFYVVAYFSGQPPRVDGQSWRLRLHGRVRGELQLTLDELRSLPSVEEMRTLECISNPPGGNLISNAYWRGVRLADLLEQAGVLEEAVEVRFGCRDGYHTSIPLSLALDPHSLLVYEMNGEELPVEHGFPLRCLWPGVYGMKQPKWLEEVEVVAQPHLGYWEQQGWSNEAPIKTNSRIERPTQRARLEPGLQLVSGVALSGVQGIARVELSTDDTASWQEARLRQLNPLVWTEWQGQWPAEEGEHVLVARATDRAGGTQERKSVSILGGTFPDGSSHMHWIRVTVARSRSLWRSLARSSSS